MNPLAPEFKPSVGSGGTMTAVPPPSASQLFELRKTNDKGLGLFATTPIKQGTLIICEEPLLKIPANAAHLAWGPHCRLSNSQKVAYDSLYSYQTGELDLEYACRMNLIDPTDSSLDEEDIKELIAGQVRVLSIFAVNNIAMPTGGLAVYATASRLNHSCVPNVHHSYNPILEKITVRAARDIYPNEELLTTYIGGKGNFYTSSERSEILGGTYGFICRCFACSDTTAASDGRRELMGSIAWGLDEFNQGAVASNAFIPANPQTALRQAEDLVTTMLLEGLVTIELGKAYHTASMQALYLGDYDKALEYARDETEVERNCLGTEVGDLRKLGVAAACWVDEVLRTIRKAEGDSTADKYVQMAKRMGLQPSKKKKPKRGKVQGGWKGRKGETGERASGA